MSARNGGPAFPIQGQSFRLGDESWTPSTPGMTLRNYFAAKADVSIYDPVYYLEGLYDRRPTSHELADFIAKLRFIEADAMLRARGEP